MVTEVQTRKFFEILKQIFIDLKKLYKIRILSKHDKNNLNQ